MTSDAGFLDSNKLEEIDVGYQLTKTEVIVTYIVSNVSSAFC